MAGPITTNPQRSESVVDKDGLPTDQQVEFNDDIELALNENLLGDSIKTSIYDVTTLPLPQDNRGGIILVTSLLGFGEIPVPCWAANPEPPLTLFDISSVTDPGSGIAQFNHSQGFLPPITRVNISGFVNPVNAAYNVTEAQITVSGTNFFQISSISFAESESVGKFSNGSNWRQMLNFAVIG